MSTEENVKVAVRVRPFNKRELDRSAKVIVSMSGNTTELTDPNNPDQEPKKFTFDFSYWSHDGFTETEGGYLEPSDDKYCHQKRCFDDIGQGILSNAWDGYNSTLFAYGQTGSGKSYSIVGYGPNKGIVPLFCERIFDTIKEKTDAGDETEYEVSFSMLEIYNEQVRDLLNPASNKKGGLKVRQHPQKGFYVESLKTTPVSSYSDIDSKMEEGTRNRTVAATLMNATSSRAHTIVGVQFCQKTKNDSGQGTTKTSVINLVDLAGSERAESTGATGDRLKEGAAINQSLSSLGNVIAALAEKAQGKKVRVPYRDSVLTKLLKNALSGNSKTAMIAALSPADINYEETLSTLRYADRAKQIKTTAVVNESPTEKLIRELREENGRLMAALAAGIRPVELRPAPVQQDEEQGEEDADDILEETDDEHEQEDEDNSGLTEEEINLRIREEVQAQVEENERAMAEMEKSWQEKLSQAEDAGRRTAQDDLKQAMKTTPHLFNLNVDNQLSGMIVYILDREESVVGGGDLRRESRPDIPLSGLNMMEQHAVFKMSDKCLTLEKIDPDAKVLVNGRSLTAREQLHHNDRIMFGSSNLYVLQNPDEYNCDPTAFTVQVNYDMAHEEIAAISGFDMEHENKSIDEMLLREDLIEMVPAVDEANAISEVLDRGVKFELVVISALARGENSNKSEVCVKMRNLESGYEYIWPKHKFFNRKYLMQEMYQNYVEHEDWALPDEKDPFTESPDTEMKIGTVCVYQQTLAYLIDLHEQLGVVDYRGSEMGRLNIELIPCDVTGHMLTEQDEVYVDNISEMVGNPLNFYINISSAVGLPNKYTEFYCKYKFYLDEDCVQTEVVSGTINPQFNHSHKFTFPSCTNQLIEYLESEMLRIELWAKYKNTILPKRQHSTKEIIMSEQLARGSDTAVEMHKKFDPEKVRVKMELVTSRKRVERLDRRLAQIKKMVEMAEQFHKGSIPTPLVRALLSAQSLESATDIINKVPQISESAQHSPTNESKTCALM